VTRHNSARALLIAATTLLIALVAPTALAAPFFDAWALEEATATPTRSNLPGWVQTENASTALFTSDVSSTVSTRVDRNTYLQVLGGGASRLRVDVYDDYGAAGLEAWVDADDVVPSAPATNWLVAANPTTLWQTADADAASLRSIEQFTPLQMTSGLVGSRVQIRVFRSDFSVVDQGWVERADTGPALAPDTHVASPDAEILFAMRSLSATSQQQTFLDATALAAQQAARLTGVPASVTVAQAILESGWGRSTLATSANNYFGMKAVGQLGNDGVVWLPTSEYNDSGQLYQTVSAFRAYQSMTDSMIDHNRLLQTSSRYAPAMSEATDPRRFAQLLQAAGYSTDPEYASKLIALMDRYNLYRLDS
jgi:hypothetical protein